MDLGVQLAVSAEGGIFVQLTLVNGDVSNIGQAFDTTVGFIESGPIDGGDAQIKKILKRLIFRFEGREIMKQASLLLYGKNAIEDPWVELIEIPLIFPGVASPLALRIQEQRYYKVRIQDLGISGNWALTGLEGWGIPGNIGRF